ncbi:MAG: tol-pal system protein YbgF [Myxococcota bacterium]
MLPLDSDPNRGDAPRPMSLTLRTGGVFDGLPLASIVCWLGRFDLMVNKLLTSLALLFGSACASSQASESCTAPLAEARARSERQLHRLTRQRDDGLVRIRELEGQMALLRAEARDLRRSTESSEASKRSGSSRDLGPSEDAGSSEDTASFDENDPHFSDHLADDGGGTRPLLRLYGHPTDLDSDALVLPNRPSSVPDRLPVTSGSPASISASQRASSAAPDTAVAQYRSALALVRDARFIEAFQVLDSFVRTYPDHPYTDNAYFWRGEVLYARRQYRRALGEFGTVVARFPRGNKVAEALLKMGMCHRRMGNPGRADEYFERVQRQFPNSVAAQLASQEEAS